MQYRSRRKFNHWLTARHKGGHGIHSPFLFRLITTVIENKGHYSAYPILDSARQNIENMLKMLDVRQFFGDSSLDRSIGGSGLKQLHLLPAKFDRLIFRLVNEFQPDDLVFVGSGFGTTPLAMALADSRKPVTVLVGNHHFRSFCDRLFELYDLPNLKLSGFKPVPASPFVVIQYPCDPPTCVAFLDFLRQEDDYHGTIILSGIHASPEMERIWDQCRSSEKVRISLDLFELGLLICWKGLQKEHFVLRF
ncbi:MAG: hypothetical protein LWW85_01450 [Marinilabiliales bacterium]|nr:hypothetical protein [Marinilabiliales bacterium]